MNNDMLLWIAQQIGYKAKIGELERDSLDMVGDVIISDASYCFDLTADTPQAAYDREKVVEWIGKAYGLSICCNGGNEYGDILWGFGHSAFGPANTLGIVLGSSDRKEAIIAACEYVWRKEVGNEPET